MILPIFQNIAGYPLDEQQQAIALEDANEVMAIAGAGSGKTMTILGRIRYIIEEKKIHPSEILCISFTRKSSESLKEKCRNAFGYDIEVKTFHRLALDILNKANFQYKIIASDYLEYMITEHFAFPKEPLLSMLFKYFHLPLKYKTIKKYQKFYQENRYQIEELKREVVTLIHLAKANNKDKKDFAMLILEQSKYFLSKKKRKQKLFLQITLYIYLIYEQELASSHSYDLDEIIQEATQLVEQGKVDFTYKQIIIDEFQDTSWLRFRLIDSIKKRTNAKLLVVGDDFQSIYRFSGCDVSLFLGFPNLYPEAKIMKIETTYRNAHELVTVAGSFVMKNPNQQKKEMHSKKHLEKPIKVVFYQQASKDFVSLMTYLIKQKETNILVLSRNNKDINTVLNDEMTIDEQGMITHKDWKEVYLRHLTVHKSKGLEEDTVILIHLTKEKDGFPGVTRKSMSSLFTQQKETYPFDEERRLFYVALTRTKGNIYLFTDKNHPSIFVKELLKDYKEIEVIRL